LDSPHKVHFQQRGARPAEVAVCVTLYDYAEHVTAALDSVQAQDLETVDLIVVDDHSTDRSLRVASDWIRTHRDRFNTALLVQHEVNQGLSAARNTGFSIADPPYVFVLDADNAIFPRCLSRCVETVQQSGAAFAYPIIERFEGESSLMSNEIWNVDRLVYSNYIDAMALVSKEAWRAVGGYSTEMIWGWEDYDLWCKFAERGFAGVQVPEILARYRVHSKSMLQTTTDSNERRVKEVIQARHPWLSLDPNAERIQASRER